MQYRIYYIDDQITSITVEKLPGDFVTVNQEIFKKVMDSPHLYMVVDDKIVEKIVEQAKKPKRLKIIDTVEFPGWIVEKDNLFQPIEYVKTKPNWYDQNKHSVAKVANCD